MSFIQVGFILVAFAFFVMNHSFANVCLEIKNGGIDEVMTAKYSIINEKNWD